MHVRNHMHFFCLNLSIHNLCPLFCDSIIDFSIDIKCTWLRCKYLQFQCPQEVSFNNPYIDIQREKESSTRRIKAKYWYCTHAFKAPQNARASIEKMIISIDISLKSIDSGAQKVQTSCIRFLHQWLIQKIHWSIHIKVPYCTLGPRCSIIE